MVSGEPLGATPTQAPVATVGRHHTSSTGLLDTLNIPPSDILATILLPIITLPSIIIDKP